MPLNMGCSTMKGEVGFSQHKPFVLYPHSDNGSSSQRRSSRYRENLLHHGGNCDGYGGRS
jgi:hypothetical protein